MKQKWFWFALMTVMLAAPNNMFMKTAVASFDPNLLNFIRSMIVFVLCIPFLAIDLPKFYGKGLRHATIAGLCMSIAAFCFIVALQYSQASYVSLIFMFSPVVLVWYSVKLEGERISRRVIAGVTLAVLGIMTVTLLPLAISQGQPFHFFPLATLLGIINCIVYPWCTIELKRANVQRNISTYALVGFMSGIVATVSLAIWIFTGSKAPTSVPLSAWMGVLYSAVVISIFCRALGILMYEKVGAATISILVYLESFVAILLPVIFLHEKLSVPMVLGGIVILYGVYLVEVHKTSHHKHHRLLRFH